MTDWTYAGAHVPWLSGQYLYVANESGAADVRTRLAAAAYTVTEAATNPDTVIDGYGARFEAYRAVARALSLPTTAGANLDALIDGLRELSERWPAASRIVLLWHGADELVTRDLRGWTTLAGALVAASADLWTPRNGRPLVFETVAFVREGYGADRP